MKVMLRAAAVVAVGTMLVVMLATGAAADPKRPPVQLTCGTAHHVVTVAGHGRFAPGHDVASNRVFIPVAFRNVHVTLTDLTTGGTVFTRHEPDVTKGHSRPAGRTLLECTYSYTDEWVAGSRERDLVSGHRYRLVNTGAVTAFVTGRP